MPNAVPMPRPAPVANFANGAAIRDADSVPGCVGNTALHSRKVTGACLNAAGEYTVCFSIERILGIATHRRASSSGPAASPHIPDT